MSLASGLPFNYVTGVNNSGDTGGTTDRPVINGVVIGRNAGHGRPVYEASPFIERPFAFGERIRLNLRAEVVQRLQPRELRRLQRNVWERLDGGAGVRTTADGHHGAAPRAVDAVFGAAEF